jgi:hypothetical protein
LQREIDQNQIAMGGLGFAGCHRCRLSRINIEGRLAVDATMAVR